VNVYDAGSDPPAILRNATVRIVVEFVAVAIVVQPNGGVIVTPEPPSTTTPAISASPETVPAGLLTTTVVAADAPVDPVAVAR
jgi:hypothetical protein